MVKLSIGDVISDSDRSVADDFGKFKQKMLTVGIFTTNSLLI
jgi:hypothetical protein